MNDFKYDAIQTVAQQVMKELNCSMIDAITKMQGTCARQNNEAMLEDLIAFKSGLIAELY